MKLIFTTIALLALFSTTAFAGCELVNTSRDVDTTRDTAVSHANDSIAYPVGDFAATSGGEEPWVVFRDSATGRSCTP